MSVSAPLCTQQVLLVLDAQVAHLTDPPVGVPSASMLRENIYQILQAARTANPSPLIIHSRNMGEDGEADEPHSPGWRLLYRPLPGEHVIDKSKNNAFVGTRLSSLIPLQAEIILIGMLSDYALKDTGRAAAAQGHQILIIKGAHGTYNRLDQLRDGGVTPAASIESQIERELEAVGACVLDMSDIPSIFNDR